ncbi:MAG: EFR1 family ferrodoxin [Promethearchaeota archaeon]
MKLLILFFSGTGNTQFIAEYIREHLLNQKPPNSLEITMATLEGFDPQMLLKYDGLVLGYPIFAGLPPVNVRKFLKVIPQTKDKCAFVYNTKGLAEGIANWYTLTELGKKGYRSLGFCSIIMPASDGISMMLTEESKTFQKYLTRNYDSIPKVDQLVQQISIAEVVFSAAGSFTTLPPRKPVKFFGFLTSAFLYLLYGLVGNSMTKKLHATADCNLCMRCVRECPQTNIFSENDEIKFHDQCIFCLRCVNICPQRAIQVGKLTVGKARWHGPKGDYRPLQYRIPQNTR